MTATTTARAARVSTRTAPTGSAMSSSPSSPSRSCCSTSARSSSAPSSPSPSGASSASRKWIGLENFTRAFNDEFVGIAFKNTLLYGLIIVPCVVVIGLAFALYVHQRWPLSGLARALFFSPYVVSATVIGLVWVWMLDTQFGLINHYLGYLGIDAVPWLTSTRWSLIGVSIASVWWDLGLAFVLFLAALQDVPRDLYEAAEVDGASRWQRLWMVILPQLRPVISLVVTLQLISLCASSARST